MTVPDMERRSTLRAAAADAHRWLALFITLLLCAPSAAAQSNARPLRAEILSSRPDLITGGDALLRISSPQPLEAADVTVTAKGRALATNLHPQNGSPTILIGRISGIPLGQTTLSIKNGREMVRLKVTNYPLTGPMLSGPHLAPFECRTEESGLGRALDADCFAPTKIEYFYRTTLGRYHPLDDPKGVHPKDLVTTMTTGGMVVPYIVRLESGVINRMIYRIAMLDNPAAPGSVWNQRLVLFFGGGCGANYNQGTSRPPVSADTSPDLQPVLSDLELARGYAYVTSPSLTNAQFCNPYLQGETALMIKEHFIETYGPPKWTVGAGLSGGSVQQHLLAQMFPGLLDGLQAGASYPDFASSNAFDCALLERVFARNMQWTPAKRAAVDGYTAGTCAANAMAKASTLMADTGVTIFPDAVLCGLKDQNLVYHRLANPGGARCTFQDMLVNLLGRDPKTKGAYLLFDNVGIQYGLAAVNAGAITPDEFLYLNGSIGGFDGDGNILPRRSEVNAGALRRAYRAGLVNSFGGGLATVPIINYRTYLDTAPGILPVHDRVEDAMIRARLDKANGRSDNQVIWTAGGSDPMAPALKTYALEVMDRWLDAIVADPAPLSAEKVVRLKPQEAVDACWDESGNRIVETMTLDHSAVCNRLYPMHSEPRIMAGGPLANDVVKCQRKPVDPGDYRVTFSSAQIARLRRIFSTGVCDYTRAGQEQDAKLETYPRLTSPPE